MDGGEVKEKEMNDAELGEAVRERRLARVKIPSDEVVAFLREGLTNGRAVRAVADGLPRDAKIMDIREGIQFRETRMFDVLVAHCDFEKVPWGSLIPELPATMIETRHTFSGPAPLEVGSIFADFWIRSRTKGADLGAIAAEFDRYLVKLLGELGYGDSAVSYESMPIWRGG